MKAMVLSSGGIDSTTCLSIAISDFGADNVSAVSVFYGQKHKKELECAKAIAAHYNINHYILDLSAVFAHSNCPLLERSSEEVIHKSYDEQIKDLNGKAVSTYVPFRNGLMLSAISSLAMSIYPDEDVYVYLGAHADDAAGNAYADCSAEFTDAIGRAIEIGTYEKIHLKAPLVSMNKAQVVSIGLRLKAPYELTWSCYEGEEFQCGTCGTCIDRKRAFEINNAVDPVPYKE